MYEEQLTALKSAYSNLTIAAKMELNCILHYYKFKSSSENKNGNVDRKGCDPSKKLLPYTDPCVDLHAILKKCKSILVNHEEIDQDWTSG